MDFKLFKDLLLRAFKEDTLPQFIMDYTEYVGDYEKAINYIKDVVDKYISDEEFSHKKSRLDFAISHLENKGIALFNANPYMDLLDKYKEFQNEDPIVIMREINQIYFPHMGSKLWDNAYNKFITNMENGVLLEEFNFNNNNNKISLNENFNEEDSAPISIYFNISYSNLLYDYDDVDFSAIQSVVEKALDDYSTKYLDPLDNTYIRDYDYDINRNEASINIYLYENTKNDIKEVLSKIPEKYSYYDEVTQYGSLHDTNYYEEPYYDTNEVEINVKYSFYDYSLDIGEEK